MTNETRPVGRDFILAGKAMFTLVGKVSRFTYKVSRKDPEPGSRYTEPTYFVGVLSGPDNQADYRYLGILDAATGYVRLTRNSKFTLDAPSAKAIQWAMPRVWHDESLAPGAIYHCGFCGRCGRLLTVPESIVTGFGPECSDLLGLTRPKISPDPAPTVRKAKVDAPATIASAPEPADPEPDEPDYRVSPTTGLATFDEEARAARKAANAAIAQTAQAFVDDLDAKFLVSELD
jgi:Family of unknown function (DUF6011)